MAVLLLTVLALSTLFRRHVPTSPPIVRFLVTPPEDSYFNVGAHMAVSPDGRHLTFVAPDSTGKDVLWVRSFDSLRARALDGTDGATFPFWSPDSRWIGFFANPNLKKIDLTGGPPIFISNAIAGNGGTWNREDVIVFGSGMTHLLYRVSAAGGQVIPLYNEKEAVVRGRRGAYFLSDGNHYLYDASETGNGPAVYVASLGSDTGKLLVQGGASPVYQQGRLLYLLGATLIAQPFDEKRLEVVGAASALAEQVQTFSTSQTGAVLAYWTGAQNMPQLTWVDRRGNQVGRLGDPAIQINIRISPDGTKVAAEVYEQQNMNSDIWHANSDIWLYDVMRGVKTRLTTGPGSARVACWTPDGKHIIFSSNRKGHYDLYEKAIDGAGSELLVFESELDKYCESFSPDGKFLLYFTITSDGNGDQWILPFFGDRKPVPYLHTEFAELGGRYSPDGKWIVYSSDESGKEEVYVRPFPESGGKLLVSTSGGSFPTWRRDGKEIFYVGAGHELMAAKITENGSTLAIDTARSLFQTNTESFPSYDLDVSADGERFLIVSASSQKLPLPIAVVINWDAGLKAQ